YFDGPAGDPAASGFATTADRTLPGCAGDTCGHNFFFPLPLGRLDGQPHPVHAYGIDLVDANAELALSPAVYACSPLPILAGVKRHIVSPDVLNAWKFSIFFDMMKVADVDLASAPVGVPVDAPPQLALAEGTLEPLWLLDQGFRRLVAPDVLGAWRFDPAAAAVLPADMLDGLPEGTPLPPRPILAQGTGPEVYLLDVRQCLEGDPDPACPQEPDDSTSGDSDDTGGDTTSDANDTSDSSTASTTSHAPTTGTTTAASSTSGPADATGTSTGSTTDAPAASETGCGCRQAPSGALLGLMIVFAQRPRRRRAAT
ncbi:MAG TPA: hypothetical protein VIK91_06425, partial [Nannocystis sp.]